MEDYTAKEARKINVGLKDVKIPGDTVLRKNIVKSFHKTFHRCHSWKIFHSTKVFLLSGIFCCSIRKVQILNFLPNGKMGTYTRYI